MNLLREAIEWLREPGRWSGDGGMAERVVEHIVIVGIVVGIAALIALPLGMAIGHTRRGAALIGALTGASRAIPTLGLLTLFGLMLGIGLGAPILALVILAIPSILAGTYSGIHAIPHSLPAAAKAIGMSPFQVLTRVELPLASPVIIGGIRSAVLQVVATATLAAYTADAGLGRYLIHGLKASDYTEMLGASIVVIALALTFEIVLAGIQKLAERKAHPAKTT